MWEGIITAVLGFVANIFTGWFSNEKKIEAEWKSRTYEAKMKSYRSSDKAEREIKKAKPVETPKNARAWNRGVGRVAVPLLFLFLILFLSGCTLFTRYVEVADRKPIIEIPERPELAEEPEFNEREVKLVNYAVELETKLTKYNEWANEENIKNGYTEPSEEDPDGEKPEEGDEAGDRDGDDEADEETETP